MYNLHPPLTAFPLAFLTSTVVLEILGRVFRRWRLLSAAKINLILAVISVCAAFFSGYQASNLANASFVIPDDAVVSHHLFGKLLLISIFPALALRIASDSATHGKGIFAWVYGILLCFSVGLMLYTGYLGSRLVFDYGAGVNIPSLIHF